MNEMIGLAFYIGKRSLNPKATFFDVMVCLVTRSRYSHVELVYAINDETNTFAGWSSSPSEGGVRHSDRIPLTAEWDLFTLEDRVSVLHPDSWFSQYAGRPYDWMGALGAKFKIFSQDNDKWFCSEIVASYLGLKRPHRLTPIKLYRHLKHRLTPLSLKRQSRSSGGF